MGCLAGSDYPMYDTHLSQADPEAEVVQVQEGTGTSRTDPVDRMETRFRSACHEEGVYNGTSCQDL